MKGKACFVAARSFFSSSSSTAAAKALLAAVVRYDNNVATIPFVGSRTKAEQLRDQMTAETHKHHVYVISTKEKNVSFGPYQTLDEAKEALRGNNKTEPKEQ